MFEMDVEIIGCGLIWGTFRHLLEVIEYQERPEAA
jgi:hypothetical protein